MGAGGAHADHARRGGGAEGDGGDVLEGEAVGAQRDRGLVAVVRERGGSKVGIGAEVRVAGRWPGGRGDGVRIGAGIAFTAAGLGVLQGGLGCACAARPGRERA